MNDLSYYDDFAIVQDEDDYVLVREHIRSGRVVKAHLRRKHIR